jgi:DNA modification methylase
MKTNVCYQGDCLDILPTLPDNSVDSIVTDPPYELGFMGKSWDNSGIAYSVPMWKECLRVLKPGGHLLSFSGTRTYHRMAVAIEDAGFEVRDMIEWCYGSGFPKSLNIGKAVDKIQGNERTPYERPDFVARSNKKPQRESQVICGEKGKYTKGTSEWEGWGTALKPAHESIMLAQKPLTSVPLFDKIDIDLIIKKILCLLVSNVKIVESNSVLSQHGLSEELNIVQWIAEENTNTQDALSVLTDMLLSESKTNTNLNIVILWLNILEDLYQLKNKFTTLTEISLTIELKILESLEWENIFQNITKDKNKMTDGKNVNVLTAVNLFNAVRLKLNHILTHFAQDPAILKDEYSDIRPKHEPICMARKPLSEKTVAENCLKWGTGGINIDESRVESSEKLARPFNVANNQTFGKYEKFGNPVEPQGRFPANLIHDNSEEVRECFPETKSQGHWSKTKTTGFGEFGNGKSEYLGVGEKDKEGGNASRFFKSIIYQADEKMLESNLGRFPANLIHDNSEEVRECFPETKTGKAIRSNSGGKTFGGDNTKPVMEDLGYEDGGGNASRFFKSIIYQAKASKSERNKNTNNYLIIEICVDNMEVAQLQPKVILEKTELWFTELFGKEKMEEYQMDFKSTIKTETKKTTILIILNYSQHLNIKEYIVGAIKTKMESGGNHAVSVENTNEWRTIITDGLMEYLLGVNPVVYPTQLKIRVNANNFHSTVKPIALMEYLIKMVTPKGGVVLDPFAGSGSTLVAAKDNGFQYIGIEMTEEYLPIIQARTGCEIIKPDTKKFIKLPGQDKFIKELIKNTDIDVKDRLDKCPKCNGRLKKTKYGMTCEDCLTDY